MSRVAVGVVLDKKVASLFVSVFANQPAGRFREEENDDRHECWTDHLEPEWKAPVGVAMMREVFVGTVDG